MVLKRTNWPAGRLLTLEHTSKVLADNPLGDPTTRLLDVWLPPQYDKAAAGRAQRYPVLFDLVGYTGSGKSHTNWHNLGRGSQVPETSFGTHRWWYHAWEQVAL